MLFFYFIYFTTVVVFFVWCRQIDRYCFTVSSLTAPNGNLLLLTDRKFEVVTQGTGKNFLELGKGSRAVTSGSQTNEWVVARVQRPSMTGGRNYCEVRDELHTLIY
jgi:hypothetical protein